MAIYAQIHAVSALFLLRLFRGHASKSRRIHEQHQPQLQQAHGSSSSGSSMNQTGGHKTTFKHNGQHTHLNANNSSLSRNSSSSCSPTIETHGSSSNEHLSSITPSSQQRQQVGTFAANLNLTTAQAHSDSGSIKVDSDVVEKVSLEPTYRVPLRSVAIAPEQQVQVSNATNYARRQLNTYTQHQLVPSNGIIFHQASNLYANEANIYNQKNHKRSPIVFVANELTNKHDTSGQINATSDAFVTNEPCQDGRVSTIGQAPTYC